MAFDNYAELCHSIYEDISRQLERSDDVTHKFAPKGLVEEVLNSQVLRHVFRCLLQSAPQIQSSFSLTESEFVRRIEQRTLQGFLAVLIFASCSVDALHVFVSKLVARDTWPVRDEQGMEIGPLPMSHDNLSSIFRDKVTVDKFSNVQVYFCTTVILKGSEVTVEHPELCRMPYLEAPFEVGNGSFGKVFRVRIARRHLFNPVTSEENTEPEALACKVLVFNTTQSSRQPETEILDRILKSKKEGCENILQSLASLKFGNTYNIFMQLAICDLQKYMNHLHEVGPNTTAAKAELIHCAGGLANGFNFLHTQLKAQDGSKLVCYHLDLKPNNILIFQDAERGEGQNVWKLSDFGMARVKQVVKDSRKETESEWDLYKWFVRQNPAREPSASATENRRGEGTYLPPESLSARRSMKSSSDIWALGCIISVLFAYLEAGADGISAYSDKREKDPRAGSIDRFFIRGQHFSPNRVHPAVSECHKQLVKSASRRSVQEADIVRDLLTFVETSILRVEQDKRKTAADVQEKLLDAYRRYLKLDVSHQNDVEGGPDSAPSSSRRQLWRSWRGQPREVDFKVQALKWQIPSTPEAFKGCVISPNGTLVAFWTDIKMVLFTSQSLSGVSPVASYGDEYSLGAENGFWNSVDLTEKYLVASTATTGSNFQVGTYTIYCYQLPDPESERADLSNSPKCYIFDLQGGMSVDPSLGRVVKVSLPYREIHRLAISPDSQKLACLLRHAEDEENPRCLFVSSISDLKEFQGHGQVLPLSCDTGRMLTISSSRQQRLSTSSEIPGLPSLISLNWAVDNVIRFMFVDNDSFYIVMRLGLSAQSHEHKIPIIFVSLSPRKTIFTLDVKSRGNTGSSNAVSFFTSLAPFNREKSCVVVTREKQLQVQSLLEHDSGRDVQMDIANYCILRLMMDNSDQSLLAIGKRSESNRLMLLEMKVPRPGETLVVNEIAQIPDLFYGDDFTERLVDANEDKFVLLTTLKRRNMTGGLIIKIPLS